MSGPIGPCRVGHRHMLQRVKVHAVKALVLMMAVCLTGPPIAAQESPNSVKVTIDPTRAGVVDEVLAAGGRLVADRGTYIVFEVDADKPLPREDKGAFVRPDFDQVHLRRGRSSKRLAR